MLPSKRAPRDLQVRGAVRHDDRGMGGGELGVVMCGRRVRDDEGCHHHLLTECLLARLHARDPARLSRDHINAWSKFRDPWPRISRIDWMLQEDDASVGKR